MSEEQTIVSPEATEVEAADSGLSNNESIAESSSESSEAVETTTTPVEKVEKVEKNFSQGQVNIISNDVKRRTEARIRAEYAAKGKNNAEQDNEASAAAPTYTEDELYSRFRVRQEHEREEAASQAVLKELSGKLEKAGNFQKLSTSGFGHIDYNHPLVPMLNSLDNAPDVIDALDADIKEMSALRDAANVSPEKGMMQLIALSESIKRNKEAMGSEKPSKPLAQIKSSSYGLGDGEMTSAEIRNLPNLMF